MVLKAAKARVTKSRNQDSPLDPRKLFEEACNILIGIKKTHMRALRPCGHTGKPHKSDVVRNHSSTHAPLIDVEGSYRVSENRRIHDSNGMHNYGHDMV